MVGRSTKTPPTIRTKTGHTQIARDCPFFLMQKGRLKRHIIKVSMWCILVLFHMKKMFIQEIFVCKKDSSVCMCVLYFLSPAFGLWHSLSSICCFRFFLLFVFLLVSFAFLLSILTANSNKKAIYHRKIFDNKDK